MSRDLQFVLTRPPAIGVNCIDTHIFLGAGFAPNPSSKAGHKNSVVILAGTTCGRKIDGRKTSIRGLYFSAPHFSARPDFCKQTPEKNSAGKQEIWREIFSEKQYSQRLLSRVLKIRVSWWDGS